MLLVVPSSEVEDEHQERFAARRPLGPAYEVDDPGGPGEKGQGRGLHFHLAGEVHGAGHVHRDHSVVARDDEGVVDVIGRVEIHGRVVVQEVIEVA